MVILKSSLPLLTLIAALGCGVIGGLLFAFSNVVMKALAQQSAQSGIATMNAINAVILNPMFLLIFIGTAIVSCLLVVLAILNWHPAASLLLLIASALYLIGVIGITGIFNIPLNNTLATHSTATPEAQSFWLEYLSTWTKWNHGRTIASIAACALFILAYGARS